jgi:hypothetical protein
VKKNVEKKVDGWSTGTAMVLEKVEARPALIIKRRQLAIHNGSCRQ